MHIISYEYHDNDDGNWCLNKTEFGRFNLLVGDSGTGKSRFLNTLFSLGTFVANKKADLTPGCWNLVVKVNDLTYKWDIEIIRESNLSGIAINTDNLTEIKDSGEEVKIIERSKENFIFKGKEMPKMAKDEVSIKLLQEEEIIAPLFKGFCHIMRRRFSDDGLANISQLQAIPPKLNSRTKKDLTLEQLFFYNFGLNAQLYLLSKYFTNIYNKICLYYKDVFPFVVETAVLDYNSLHKEVAIPGKVPVFCIKEKGNDKWFELPQLSSGMQKVLLILTDMYLVPDDGIYMIDEYENSLGISAINFFPEILLNIDTETQLFITSHHPYIINNIPIKNWYVFHRKGNEIVVKHGEALISKYGKSKQEAFIQLINDPYYREGIE